MVKPAPPTRRTPPALRLLANLLMLLGLALAGWWAWQQPFMAAPRMWWEISRADPPASLPVPVDGVSAGDIADTWGAARGADRSHEGVDIFAPRGTPVRSTTRGVVSSLREGGL